MRALPEGCARALERLQGSPFFASMAVLSGGTVVGALIGLAATPALSRIYSPSDFGVLGIYAAALSLFSVVATLRYDRAIPGCVGERQAASLLVVALGTIIATSAICLVLVVTGAIGLIVTGAREHVRLLAWALPLGMIGSATYETLTLWMVRRRRAT